MRNPLCSSGVVVFLCLASLLAPICLGQSSPDQTTGNVEQPQRPPLPRLGAAFKVSSLGIGFDVATAITRRSNVRVGLNQFNFNQGFDKDGIHYEGSLSLRSVGALFDWQVAGPFHVSPGVLIYNGNHIGGNASVPGGRSFSLGGNDYISSPSNPVTGLATVDFKKAAPMLLLGFGNLLPRSKRHFTMNFEIGVVFQGTPRAALSLNGSTCNSAGFNCVSIASNSSIQTQIQAEQDKINNSLKSFQFYPVISLSIGFK